MLFISNRGNLSGIEESLENNPEYVSKALEAGYHVVVDVWLIDNSVIALGNYNPQYNVTIEFLSNPNIICRAKSIRAFEILASANLHVFYKETERVAFSNRGLLFVEPDMPITRNCVCSLPERIIGEVSKSAYLQCSGIWSSQIKQVRELWEANNKKEETIEEEMEEKEE